MVKERKKPNDAVGEMTSEAIIHARNHGEEGRKEELDGEWINASCLLEGEIKWGDDGGTKKREKRGNQGAIFTDGRAETMLLPYRCEITNGHRVARRVGRVWQRKRLRNETVARRLNRIPRVGYLRVECFPNEAEWSLVWRPLRRRSFVALEISPGLKTT